MALFVSFVNTSLLNIFEKWNSSIDDTGEKVLLRGYCQGMLDRATVKDVLEIGKSAL